MQTPNSGKKGTKRKSIMPDLDQARAKCQASATTLLDNQHAIVVATINEYLAQDFALAVRVMIMLQNGELSPKAPDSKSKERRFTSQNKMRLVKADIIHEFLDQLQTQWATYLKETPKAELSMIFACAQNVELGCAVWCKNIDQFVTNCVARYGLAGKAFHTIWQLDPNASKDDWRKMYKLFGYFKLVPSDAEGEHYEAVVHISGKTVPLPDEDKAKNWEIIDNLNFHMASLKCGLSIIKIKELFAVGKVKLEEPLMMKEAGPMTTPPKLTVSQTGLGPEAQPQQALVPAGDGAPNV
jgi:hypothetical protein